MAWQLIYTSAPRLLEAGRTGFGTVARHRAISGMLASTVERFSQFARLPGHDPRRVVHTYRIVTVGSSSFHVFSCLQDAGSDYSGRTNHLAHHLIAEAREIRTLAGSGLTPADVLLRMAWLSSWTEPPQYMDPTSEIALSSFSVVKSTAWATLTGNPDSARLLCTPAAMKGTYLICPPNINPLELFRESLLHAPQSGWQTSFTTGLEPNDEVGDFRWIGIPAASPLRGQVETSNRTVLDLTQPALLPQPPAPVAPEPQPVAEPEPEGAPASSQAGPSPPKVTLRQELPTSQASAASPMGNMGGWDPQSRKKAAPQKNNTPLIYSIVLVAAVIISVVGYVARKSQNEEQAKENFELQVDRTWDKWVVPGVLPQTKAKIAGQEDIEEGRRLLNAHRKYFEQLNAALSKPGAPQDVGLPAETEDEITDLQKAFTEWQEIDTRLKHDWQALTDPANPIQLGSLLEKYDSWQIRKKSAWTGLTSYLKGVSAPPAAPAFRQALLQSIKQHVSASPWDSNELAALETLNKRLGPDDDLTRWMQFVSGLEGSDKAVVAENIMQDDKLPQWLRGKARQTQERQVKNIPKSDPMANAKANARTDQKVKVQAPEKEDADSFKARNPVFICSPKAGEELLSQAQKITLPVAPEMQLYVGAASDKYLPPGTSDSGQADKLKLWKKIPLSEGSDSIFGESIMATSNLKFTEQGQISQLPLSSSTATQGLRIVACSKDNNTVLFDLRILPQPGAAHAMLFAEPLKITSPSAEPGLLPNLGKLIKRLTFGDTLVSYKLRPLNTALSPYDIRALSMDAYEVIFAPPVTIDMNRRITEKKRQISDLEAGVKSLETQKKGTIDNMAGYADKMAKFDRDIATKNQSIAALNAEIAELQKPADLPRMKVQAGEYTLIALLGSETVLEVSKVHLAIDKSNL